MLVVSEIFGPTFQGEGASLGRRAGFVRLGRCNLRCTFCDTPYTWDWDRFDPGVELHEVSVDAVLSQLDAMDVALVVVTGGEPLIQQQSLAPLLVGLKRRGYETEIETAGTIAPTSDVVDNVDRFNVSPKLENSGNPVDRRYRPDVLRALEDSGKAAFKFVACSVDDLDEIAGVVDDCGLTNVWVMPEGTDPATLRSRMHDLADGVLVRGWNLTTRLHILLWGDERGR